MPATEGGDHLPYVGDNLKQAGFLGPDGKPYFGRVDSDKRILVADATVAAALADVATNTILTAFKSAFDAVVTNGLLIASLDSTGATGANGPTDGDTRVVVEGPPPGRESVELYATISNSADTTLINPDYGAGTPGSGWEWWIYRIDFYRASVGNDRLNVEVS
jgi:hypothetical protein